MTTPLPGGLKILFDTFCVRGLGWSLPGRGWPPGSRRDVARMRVLIVDDNEANRNRLLATILSMSGYTDDAVFRHGLLEKGRVFLQKPFTPETLARKVREALGG